MSKQATVDGFLASAEKWQQELMSLCSILRQTELEETIKWGAPVYTYSGKNVVGVGAFQSYFGLWFYQGALLADEKGLLINAQEGKTRALRQLRWHRAEDLDPRLVKNYVKEALALAKKGAEIKPRRNQPLVVPPELQSALAKSRSASAGFEKLTIGKRREYVDYISAAKRDETKARRVERVLPLIVAAKGLNDKYRA